MERLPQRRVNRAVTSSNTPDIESQLTQLRLENVALREDVTILRRSVSRLSDNASHSGSIGQFDEQAYHRTIEKLQNQVKSLQSDLIGLKRRIDTRVSNTSEMDRMTDSAVTRFEKAYAKMDRKVIYVQNAVEEVGMDVVSDIKAKGLESTASINRNRAEVNTSIENFKSLVKTAKVEMARAQTENLSELAKVQLRLREEAEKVIKASQGFQSVVKQAKEIEAVLKEGVTAAKAVDVEHRESVEAAQARILGMISAAGDLLEYVGLGENKIEEMKADLAAMDLDAVSTTIKPIITLAQSTTEDLKIQIMLSQDTMSDFNSFAEKTTEAKSAVLDDITSTKKDAIFDILDAKSKAIDSIALLKSRLQPTHPDNPGLAIRSMFEKLSTQIAELAANQPYRINRAIPLMPTLRQYSREHTTSHTSEPQPIAADSDVPCDALLKQYERELAVLRDTNPDEIARRAWPVDWPIYWEGGDPTGLGRKPTPAEVQARNGGNI